MILRNIPATGESQNLAFLVVGPFTVTKSLLNVIKDVEKLRVLYEESIND